MSSLQQWNIAIGKKNVGLGILVGGLDPSVGRIFPIYEIPIHQQEYNLQVRTVEG